VCARAHAAQLADHADGIEMAQIQVENVAHV
jgi:hypothetical protein